MAHEDISAIIRTCNLVWIRTTLADSDQPGVFWQYKARSSSNDADFVVLRTGSGEEYAYLPATRTALLEYLSLKAPES